MTHAQLHLTVNERAEQLAQIRRACTYITDDLAIAQFIGVPVELVADQRTKLPRERTPTQTGAGVSDATYHLDERARRSAAEKSCKALLERLIHYGLKHDSDLGMGFEPFMARARELGLAALMATHPRKTNREPWTPSKDATLYALRSDGWTFARIADEFSISRNAAIGRYHRMAHGVEARSA